jgi:uncharacterized protein
MNNASPSPSGNEIHWLLTSPALFAQIADIPLMPCEARSRIAHGLRQFIVADENTEHLPNHGRTNLPLGHHAERLLAHALSHCPGIELIAQQKAIRVNTQTIGELDLLYDDHERQRRVHCELSVRILLQRHPHAEWNAWCGTDPRQILSDKLLRLRDHQIPLGQHPDVPRHPTWPTVSEALILGWLLQPIDKQWPDLLGAAPDHLRGWWLRHGEHDIPRASRAARFVIIPPDHWMAFIELPNASSVLAPGELSTYLRHHFSNHENAVLVAEVVRNANGQWQEVTRGAVVHKRWPEMPLKHPPA